MSLSQAGARIVTRLRSWRMWGMGRGVSDLECMEGSIYLNLAYDFQYTPLKNLLHLINE